MSEEEDPPTTGPRTEKDKESRLSSERSEYLTGDEKEVANEQTVEEDPSLQALKRTLELESAEENDTSQIVSYISFFVPYIYIQVRNGDDRPISSLATPLKLVSFLAKRVNSSLFRMKSPLA